MKDLKTFEEFVNENKLNEITESEIQDIIDLNEGLFGTKIPEKLQKELKKFLAPIEKKYGGLVYLAGEWIYRLRDKVLKVDPKDNAKDIASEVDITLDKMLSR